MSTKSKILIKDILVYGLNNLISKLVALFTIPIFTRIFDSNQYGILDTTSTLIAMMAILLSLAMDMAIQRYFFIDDNLFKKEHLISTSFWFLILWGIFTSLILSLITPTISLWLFKSEVYSFLLRLAIISNLLNLLFNFCLNLLRLNFKTFKFTVLSTIKGVGTALCSLIFVIVFRLGIEGFFLGSILMESIILVPAIISIKKDIRFSFKLNIIFELLKYSLPFVPASIAYWIFNLSDRIILGKLSSLSEVGLYGIANRLTSILPFIVLAFSKAWVPRAFEWYKASSKNFDLIINTVQIYVALFFSSIAIFLSVLSKEILIFLVTPQFYRSYLAVAPLSLSMVAYALGFVVAIGIYIKKQSKYINMYSWISASTNIILNFIFVPLLGMLGASLSTFFSYFTVYIGYLFASENLMGWKLDKVRPISMFGISSLYIIGGLFINIDNIYISTFIKLIYCFTYFILLIVLKFITIKELVYITNQFNMFSSFNLNKGEKKNELRVSKTEFQEQI